MSAESDLRMSTSLCNSEENIMKVNYRHFKSNSLFLLEDHKTPGSVATNVDLQGLFKDLLEFMNNKSDEIILGAGVLLSFNLVTLTF